MFINTKKQLYFANCLFPKHCKHDIKALKQTAIIHYWIDFIEEMSQGRLQNSVYSITYEIFNAFQQIIKCDERTFSLNMCISVQQHYNQISEIIIYRCENDAMKYFKSV